MKKLLLVMAVAMFMLFSTVFSSAAGDANVILVNPTANSTVYSNNLLISIKLTAPKTIKVRVFEEKQVVNGTLSAVNLNTLTNANGTVNGGNLVSASVMVPAMFTSNNNLSFYTKQINGLVPGLYRIQIDSLDGSGKVTDTKSSYVAVKGKPTETESKIFETPQTGTMQFLQNLLKTIFGD